MLYSCGSVVIKGTSNRYSEHETHTHNLGVVVGHRYTLYSELKGEQNKLKQRKYEMCPLFESDVYLSGL